MPVPRVKKTDTEPVPEGAIVVTAQQSRFHELDDSAAKDIDVGNLSINVGRREILQSTRLVLKAGLRYVFVGRNGLGKSTVLKALAERRIPGIAPNIRILLLDQTIIEQSQKEMLASKSGGKVSSVLESVVGNDKIRQRLVEDSSRLSGALQGTADDPSNVVGTYRQLRLEQIQRDLEAARLVAQHRSGARGSKARQVVIQKEAEVAEAEKESVYLPI